VKTLEARSLVKSYKGKRVVNGVGFSVSSGEVVGLLGPNGAGKTTSFYMVVGLTRPDAGHILLAGEEITDLPMYARARKGISYLSQEPSVFRKLTVAQNIMAILETLPLSAPERQERLEILLGELSISHLADRRAHNLSGGERRRLEITRALVTSPAFILLDEPFAGIDPIAILDIQKIIHKLRSMEIGILITDHNVQETLAITDRAYIMNQGVVLEAGTPDQIAASERAREIYLGEKFRLLSGDRT
jgi:lipopolysaccharide export system ATP-binding protein